MHCSKASVGFNQFLIDDEHPTLIHAGYHDSYEAVRTAVAEVLDPKRLAYVVLAHFESDECGGMDRSLIIQRQRRTLGLSGRAACPQALDQLTCLTANSADDRAAPLPAIGKRPSQSKPAKLPA